MSRSGERRGDQPCLAPNSQPIETVLGALSTWKSGRQQHLLRVVRKIVRGHGHETYLDPHPQSGTSLLPPRLLVLLCHKRSLAFTRRQHGHRGSVLSKAAAISNRKVVMDDGTWRCVRWAAARLVVRG